MIVVYRGNIHIETNKKGFKKLKLNELCNCKLEERCPCKNFLEKNKCICGLMKRVYPLNVEDIDELVK